MKRNLVDDVKKKENKKKLSTAATSIGLPQGTKLYINDNKSPNMMNLAFNARVLKRKEQIADTWFSNAAVRIKTLDGRILKITHDFDLYEAFPDFQGFSFDTSLYQSPDDDDRDFDRWNNLEGAWPAFYPQSD